MSRLIAFRFQWTDAWFRIDEGYDSIIETSDGGSATIKFLVNNKPYDIVLTGREDEFICDLQLLNGWNKKCYENNYVFDGTMWNLLFIYDDVKVFAQGSNAFLKNF